LRPSILPVHAPIYYDTRWTGSHGIGRFAQELQARLRGIQPLRIIGAKLSLMDPLASSLALARCCHGCFLSPGFNAPLHSPIPFSFTIHDLIHLRVPGESSRVRRLYYATVVRPAAKRAARIFTVSEYSRREIIEWAGVDERRVVVVGNGVSEAFTPGPVDRTSLPERPYFLHVGRRASHKNVGRLLAAYAASRAGAHVDLVFTGHADESTLGAARRLGIPDSCLRFSGNVNDAALANLYRGATALVFPSLYEGFGIPIVEAMACGTPVITAKATATPEVAGEGNALLVDPEREDELAAAIVRVLEDQALRERLAARGLERAREFTWSNVAKRVEDGLGATSL
jgi:glycosyltransferase involved in cell wall biosynthesis